MRKIDGRFRADLLPGGNVQMQFKPNKTDGNPYPLLAKTSADAECDFISVFEFSPAKAKEYIAELQKHGFIEATASADESKLRAFALIR